jgi:hypothetical protein
MPIKRAQLQEAARLACYSAYAAYTATLRGDVPAGSHKNFDPVVGEPVVEVSTISMWDDPERYAVREEFAHLRDVLNCIGTLERIAWEPCHTPEEWEELKTEGEEVPKQKAWYIRTLDGREFRWENANFIRVPNTRDFRVMNPIED